jgi:hypothetical protein
MSRIDYYRAVVLGAVLGMSFLSLFYMVNVAVDTKEPKPPEPQFDVVAKYQGCDVVRFDNQMDARYHYFLHCK